MSRQRPRAGRSDSYVREGRDRARLAAAGRHGVSVPESVSVVGARQRRVWFASAGIKHRRELDEHIEAALRAATLWDEVASRLDDSALSLSLGQQQRLVIARAIAFEPAILLLDEPGSALDPVATLRFEELLHEVAKRHTIVLVTHNMQQAARVSDFTEFLHQGRLIEFGDTDALFTHPLQRQTEDFITSQYG